MENFTCKRGDNNFYVEIKSMENHTWQGNVTWMEGNRSEYFRSTLELMKLIDSTLEKRATAS